MSELQLKDGYCCTCLKVRVAGDKFISLDFSPPEDISYKNKLKSCIPEMALEGTEEGTDCLLCKPCLAALETAYTFRCMCLRTESRLKEYKLLQSNNLDNQGILKQEVQDSNDVKEPPILQTNETLVIDSCSVTNSNIPQPQEEEEENCYVAYDVVENTDPLYFSSESEQEVEYVDLKLNILDSEIIPQSASPLTSDCSKIKKHRTDTSKSNENNSLNTKISELQNMISETNNSISKKREIQELDNLPSTNQSVLQSIPATTKPLSDTEIIKWCCKTIPELDGYTSENFDCKVSLEKLFVSESSVKIVSVRTKSIKKTNTRERRGSFWCNMCNRNLSRRERFHAHMLRHANIRGYKCDICRRGFFSLDSLRSHERKCVPNRSQLQKNVISEANLSNLGSDTSDNVDEKQVTHINTIQENINIQTSIKTEVSKENSVINADETSIKRKAKVQKRIIKSKQQKCCEQKEENCNDKSKVSTPPKPRKPKIRVEFNELGDKVYRCVICNYQSFTKGKYNLHMLHHTSTRPFPCNKCPKAFFENWELNRHLRNIHSISTATATKKPNTRMVVTHSDSATIATRKSNTGMVATHSDSATTATRKPNTGMVVTHSDSATTATRKPNTGIVVTHSDSATTATRKSNTGMVVTPVIQSIHSLAGPSDQEAAAFPCKRCDLRFQSKHLLASHAQSHALKLFCHICSVKFGTEAELKQHESEFHQLEDSVNLEFPANNTSKKRRKYYCDICNLEFASRDHANIHTGARPYDCTMCEKQFGAYTTLQKHRLTHTKASVVKTKAPVVKTKSPVVKAPVAKTSPKMATTAHRTMYECDICKKKFFKHEQLYSHDCQNASGDSVYRCQICKTVFIGRSALIEHMGIHVNQQNESE